MPTVVKPKPEFLSLTREQVERAVADPNVNPIATEVARLLKGYTANFVDYVRKSGRFPPSIMRVKGQSEIEEYSMQLTSKTIRDALRGVSQ